jgi:hypothetical protein
MNHFQVTTPDSQTHERSSLNAYTHAVIVNYGEAWGVLLWSPSKTLAEKGAKNYGNVYPPEMMNIVAIMGSEEAK